MQTSNTSIDLLNAFKQGSISLGQLAQLLNQSLETTILLLGEANIAIADYSIEEELAVLNRLGL